MSGETINVTVALRRDIAAVTAAWIAGRPTDPAALAAYPATPEAWLQSVVDSACYSYRDQYRTDAITTAAFILRFEAGELTGIRTAATQVPQLALWLSRIESESLVWLGSEEAEAGKAELVAANLLTQARADAIFFYPIPETPA